jgi:hypothetical protein
MKPAGLTPWRWLEYLVAILIGNALYFLVLVRHLPPVLQHQPFRLDAGFALDGILCVAVYGLIRCVS